MAACPASERRPAVTGVGPCPAGWLCVASSRLSVSGSLLWVGALRRSAPVVLRAAGWGPVTEWRCVSVRLACAALRRVGWAEVLGSGGASLKSPASSPEVPLGCRAPSLGWLAVTSPYGKENDPS